MGREPRGRKTEREGKRDRNEVYETLEQRQSVQR